MEIKEETSSELKIPETSKANPFVSKETKITNLFNKPKDETQPKAGI